MPASPTSLSQLQEKLAAEAARSNCVTLDSSFLTQRVLDLIERDLRPDGATLQLAQVDAGRVTISADGKTLFVSGAHTPGTASAGFLNLVARPVDLAITASSQDPGFDIVLRVGLAPEWAFGQSYKQFALGLFDDDNFVAFSGDRHFYFSSYSSAMPDPPWPGEASGGGPELISRGGSFAGDLTLGGLFGLVPRIIGISPPSAPCYGPIAWTEAGPTLDLRAPLGTGRVSFGFITADAPWAGVAAEYLVLPPDAPETGSATSAEAGGGTPVLDTSIYLGTRIDLGASLPFTIRAALGLGSNSVRLSIADPQALTLANLAKGLMGGSAAESALIGMLPQTLQSLLSDISLEAFDASFDVLPSPRMNYVHVRVGTNPPWSLFGGYTLDLSLDWMIQFLDEPYHYVTFKGVFTPKPALSFDVTVSLDNGAIESITGTEHGTIELSLSDLDGVFGGDLRIPPDLLQVGIADFSIAIDPPSQTYDMVATVSASVGLFGTRILAIDSALVAVHIDSTNSDNNTVAVAGLLSLGPITASVSAKLGKTSDTVLTVQLVDETVGSMLGHLVHLVDPTYDISLPEPWDRLLDIRLDAFVLGVTLPAKGSSSRPTVSLTYSPGIHLGFLEVDTITLTYSKPPAGSGASSVRIAIDGSFLGQSFGGGSGRPALGWDAMTESPPAVPGKGAQLFDLEYVGLGQHVALTGPDLTTVEKVMGALRSSVIPVQPGQLPSFGGQSGIGFSAKSKWLIGAQFTVMDTVAISAIFNDPDLYGILIKLSGEKAKIFAGLQFEILYRKVTDSIGVYHIELTLPDAMRHLQFGAVSITLPVLVLDVYTNGNFRVDLGFPTGLDFSNSFCVQVFPFIGYGGFYFALLDGATSSRVPQITNGSFSPVIEFGIALSLGVGKTVDEGILKGGISVTVVGVLQGVLGWFHPTDGSPKDVYHRIQGTVSVVGKLYATIDFAIIQASVDVTAYISATLTIESYEPIYIEATASVSVRVSVKIVFFTIHFSFSATVDASFTIGSAGVPPWKLAAGGGASPGGQRLLMRGQRTLHAPHYRHGRRAAAMRRAALAEPPAVTNWPAACVLGARRTVPIWAIPSFTKSETEPGVAEAVLLLGAENSVDPGAATHSDHRLLHGADPASSPFNLLMEAMLRWGILASAGSTSRVSADELAALRAQLSQEETIASAFDYGVLTSFLAANFTFRIVPAADQLAPAAIAAAPAGAVRTSGTSTITTAAPHGLAVGDSFVLAGVADPSFDGSGSFTVTAATATTLEYAQRGLPDTVTGSGGGTVNKASGVAMFPMIPEIALSDSNGIAVAFGSFNEVGQDYQDKVREYFRLLQVQFDARKPSGGGVPLVADAPEAQVSIATVIFCRYFNMLMSAGVKAAIDLMSHYPYRTSAPTGMAAIDAALGTELVSSPLQVVAPNQSKPVLAAGAVLPLANVVRQVRLGETFASIAARLASAGAFDQSGSPYAAPALVASNVDSPGIFNSGAATWPIASRQRSGGITTLTTAGDHGLVGGDVVTVSGTGDPSFDGTFKVAEASGSTFSYAQPGQPDQAAAAAAGSASAAIGLRLSGLSYSSQTGDTLGLIATRLLLRAAGPQGLGALNGVAQAAQALLALPANAHISDANALIDPRLVYPPAGTPPTVALVGGGTYTVVTGDTLTLIAAYQLAMAQRAVGTDAFLQALAQLNPSLPTDPTAPIPAGTAIALPAVARPFQPGDTIRKVASSIIAPVAAIEAALAAAPAGLPLLAPQAVLAAPLVYEVQAGDTFSAIAAKFDQTLHDVADSAALVDGLFAADSTLIIDDLPAVDIDTLIGTSDGHGLLGQSEWNNASGMVSRFLLSGLRLPDPDDPVFQALTIQQLSDPTKLGGIATKPLFVLTGQQYRFGSVVPEGYAITLANASGAQWLEFASGTSASFGLTANEIDLQQKIVSQPLLPQMQTPQRMALFRMQPSRIPLHNHIAWQAAVLPGGQFAAPEASGNPSIWLLPETATAALAAAPADPAPHLYELVTMKGNVADPAATADQAALYSWATIVDLAVSLPQSDGPAPSLSNAYVLEGADDAGAALLQQVQRYLAGGESASLYLLYSPDPASANSSGLASDSADAAATVLIKANLSTLTHSGGPLAAFAVADPTDVYSARLQDHADFLALAWEASITRSGGFYLNYVNANGGGGLPPSVFGSETRATISLVVVLDGQAANRDAPILPFNNCVVVGGNIDTTVTSLFIQPATATVQDGQNSLSAVQAQFNADWGTSFSVTDVAALNAGIPLLLSVGATLAIPNQAPYRIAYGDTLASIVADPALHLPSLEALVGAGGNADAPILAPGAQMQFGKGVLRAAATVPPGTVGFEITRTNPDPQNLPYPQLPAQALVGQLFNLVAFSIADGGGFVASGAGLPTTPSESLGDGTDGLGSRDAADAATPDWYYHQTLAVAPFARAVAGSASPALPPAASNPYNGVGFDPAAQRINAVTIALNLQDIYGNAQPLAAPDDAVSVPVGYYDDLAGLGSWPSLGISYAVSGTPPAAPAVTIAMSMQQARYVPSPSLSVQSALAAVAADLATYRRIYYQLVQPDTAFSLTTTLDRNGAYPLSKAPFLNFAAGACVYLFALATLEPVTWDDSGDGMSVGDVTGRYGVTAGQLFEANRNQPYSAVFPLSPPLQVPEIYSVLAGDSLISIVNDPKFSSFGLNVATLAGNNADAPLAEGIELVIPPRNVVVPAAGPTTAVTLGSVANAAKCSAAALAQANRDKQGILTEGLYLALGTRSLQLSATDTFASAASLLGATVAALAEANRDLAGLLVTGAQLDVDTVLAARGDTLTTLAAVAGQGIGQLAVANEELANVFAAATPLVIGTNPHPVAPASDDTLASFAQANGIGLDELAAANSESALFAPGAKLAIPSVVANVSAAQFCTYAATPTDTLASIASLFAATPAAIAALNPDLPGLLAAGQTIADSASGKSVTTAAGDSFASVMARFAAEGVTVGLDALAAGVAAQRGLLEPEALWICPPMSGNANGKNEANSLAGLSAAYGTDAMSIAAANAAAVGFLAAGKPLTLAGVKITTNEVETLNSLLVRAAAGGSNIDLKEAVRELADIAGLIDPEARVLPLPPTAPGVQTTIQPNFPDQLFPIAVDLTAARDPDWVDPDFRTVASVSTASFAVPAAVEAGAEPLALGAFADALEAALPGLQVATGGPQTERAAAGTRTVWAVNFGNAHGPSIGYRFDGTQAAYFALPPLSTSLASGLVPVQPYVSGSGLSGPAQKRSFQSIDLDVWLKTFLDAVDQFLSPAFAVPAFAIRPAAVDSVISAKQALAAALSGRIARVLADGSEGSPADACDSIRQALLQRLSSAYSVDAVLQVPVQVSSTGAGGPVVDPKRAPRLSGNVVPVPPTKGDLSPDAFSLSTAKVSLTDSSVTAPSASFLFSVKAPAENRSVALDLQYVVTEIEIPDPGATIGDYEGSSWLTLVNPRAGSASTIGRVDIPVPLRAYPAPVTLLSQSAVQAVAAPSLPADLLPWTFDFSYRHSDAEQDTPLVRVDFAGSITAAAAAPPERWFAALAQFVSAWTALKDDLALLLMLTPGSATANPSAILTAAVESFAVLASGVAASFGSAARLAARSETPPTVFRFEKGREAGKLTTLTVTSTDEDGNPVPNPGQLWPSVWIYPGGPPVELVQSGTPTPTAATYSYPPGSIGADSDLAQDFLFGGLAAPALAQNPGVQTFRFANPDIFGRDRGRAAVSIIRNLDLIDGAATNPAFIYRTPFDSFTSDALASVAATAPIPIGSGPPAAVASALNGFFAALFAGAEWPAGSAVQIRFAAAYSFMLGEAGLSTRVPILLVPSFALDPLEPGAFAAEVQSALELWSTMDPPLPGGGSFLFDLTVYSGADETRTLIAATLSYDLSAPNA